MKKRKSILLTAMAAVALGTTFVVSTAHAAEITYRGVDESTLAEWRTTTTSKSLDIDGDDIYGTEGYYAWATGSTGDTGDGTYGASNPLDGLPTGVTLTEPDPNRSSYSATYPEFDNPTATPGSDVADIHSGLAWREIDPDYENNFAYGKFIDINFASAVSETVRIGLIHNGKGMRVTGIAMNEQDVGNFTAKTGLDTLDSSQFRYFFFDIDGIQAGDTFGIFLQGEHSDTNKDTMNLGLSGLSLDVIPEPATLGLLGIAGLAIAWYRRRFIR